MTWRLDFIAVGLMVTLFPCLPGLARAEKEDIAFADGVVPYLYRYLLFTSDDKHLLAFGCNATLRVYEVGTGKRVKVLWLPSPSTLTRQPSLLMAGTSLFPMAHASW